MLSAVEVKRAASQIDEIVHAVGTLLALQGILDADETTEFLSLCGGKHRAEYLRSTGSLESTWAFSRGTLNHADSVAQSQVLQFEGDARTEE